MGVHSRLHILLAERRMTQKALEEATGLSRGTITALYHDRATRVDFRVVEKLCKALKCNVGDLFTYTPDEEEA